MHTGAHNERLVTFMRIRMPRLSRIGFLSRCSQMTSVTVMPHAKLYGIGSCWNKEGMGPDTGPRSQASSVCAVLVTGQLPSRMPMQVRCGTDATAFQQS